MVLLHASQAIREHTDRPQVHEENAEECQEDSPPVPVRGRVASSNHRLLGHGGWFGRGRGGGGGRRVDLAYRCHLKSRVTRTRSDE